MLGIVYHYIVIKSYLVSQSLSDSDFLFENDDQKSFI